MLELRRAGRSERMGGNYFNHGYYPYWSSIILALYPYQKSIEFIDYPYYCADLGVADKGGMMFFPIKIVDF